MSESGLGSILRLLQAADGLRPVAAIDSGSCTRRHGSSCDACVQACPVGAIVAHPDLHQAPSVQADACVSCGLCVPACPSGAVSGAGIDPALLVDTADASGSRLEIRCSMAAADKDSAPEDLPWSRTVPCVAALDQEVFAAAAARLEPGGRLDLVRGACNRCALGAGATAEAVMAGAVALARQVAPDREVRSLERTTPRVDADLTQAAAGPAPERTDLREHHDRKRHGDRDPRTVSRRGFFRGRRYDRAEPFDDQPDRTPTAASARDHAEHPALRARRQLLAATPEAPTPRPFSEAGCTACGACVDVCPTQALVLDRTRSMATLGVEDHDCIACGECVRVCPEDVLALGCSLPGSARPSLGPLILGRVALAGCSRCGRGLAPGEPDMCASCASRRSILDDAWAQFG